MSRWIVCFLLCLQFLRAGEIVPTPKSVVVPSGETPLSQTIQTAPAFQAQAEALASALETLTGKPLSIEPLEKEWGKNHTSIRLVRNDKLPAGAYSLSTAQGCVLTASTSTGMAHATASFLQIISGDKESIWKVAPQLIKDQPDFSFRCFMVDMGRNPHSPATLKRVVDMCWLAKVNYLQLHLTDDQLISFPSTAYPKLQSTHAGWTLAQFKELEAYSQARGVTIIPELDVPGHSTLLRKQYPDVFGKTTTDLASLDSAFTGVTTLLSEMMDVFQATPYIHIGGDEAWDVDEQIQRDFINRVHRFVKSKGRKTLVWEGPRLGVGENKVDEDVIHVNWRTVNFKAQDMIDAGYDIINAAWDPMYIVDHYPRTMFTAVPVDLCYHWNPKRFAHINHQIETFSQPHFIKNTDKLLGFCMPWWEGREENLIPLCFDRLVAVSARAWNLDGETNLDRFLLRSARLKKLFNTLSPPSGKDPIAHKQSLEKNPHPKNLAFGKAVSVSVGALQPYFGPQRLTNGITDRFDHFLGFPTVPEPLEITIDLESVLRLTRVDVYEAAVNKSWEKYEILVSENGKDYQSVGQTKKGSRGKKNVVQTTFDPAQVRFVKIRTNGCQDLTFPSFSRLCEIMVFE